MGCVASKKKIKPESLPTQIEHTSSKNRVLKKEELKIEASNFVWKGKGSIKDHYKMEEQLGKGAFGFVRLATHIATGQKRAIKTIHKSSIINDDAERKKFISEIEILRKADHPNIVKLYEFYEDEEHYHLVTEHVKGGELFDYIIKSKMLSEKIAAHFMSQLLSAVLYCHANNIVHRDLKPENLLLETQANDANLKVIDFGTSAIFEPCKNLTQKYGTAYYIAPEVLRKDYNEKCDIWSCGVILYILLCGKPPFYGRNDRDIIRRVEKGEFSMKGSEWDVISPQAKLLISKMLDFDPQTRISASEAVQDEWICRFTDKSDLTETQELTSLDVLKSFRAEEKLQYAVLSFISSQLISREESKQLTEMFRSLDINGDGKISKDELLEAYSKTLGRSAAIHQVEQIMAKVDANNSGFIDYSEFMMAATALETLISKENLKSAFTAFDADGNGKISAKELKMFLGTDLAVSDMVWKDMISEVDLDGDGEVDIVEFENMMIKLIKSSPL
ncbi:unnamed protein product [Blepharisma stoltei]|uniref:Calcium-dependent protein kinase 1 n=1 Tax=Blepharisma stoltei TaxID=1481888 RepID=A0AAU9K874_9CILI|nr:unnamed protein product [Blepharisma stoltei]